VVERFNKVLTILQEKNSCECVASNFSISATLQKTESHFFAIGNERGNVDNRRIFFFVMLDEGKGLSRE
jgi:hypothetical protein